MHTGLFPSTLLILVCFLFLPIRFFAPEKQVEAAEEQIDTLYSTSEQIYRAMALEGIIDFQVFEKAYTGYEKLDTKNKNILSIIDFSLPSSEKRLYVLDLKNKEILFESYVAHGKNSGNLYATQFSNKHGSYQSSLGFYETENTYTGKNGYSLILNGLEKGINDQAKTRAIVIHGADYCNPAIIKTSGRLGRSFGCPSLPQEVAKPIINTIKNGSLLFIYAANSTYLTQSKLLKKEFTQEPA